MTLYIYASIMCAIGNFIYQYINKQDYGTAIERTYFQCISLLIAYMVSKGLEK